MSVSALETGDEDRQMRTIRYTTDKLHRLDMAANASSTFNSSEVQPFNCYSYQLGSIIACTVVRIILTLPLNTLVLYLGHQRWRQQRSFKTTSHSDIFTYHMVAINLIWVLGGFCSLYGMYANSWQMVRVFIYAMPFVFFGEAYFHVLTCVERYLAVVHPIIYLGLKNARGARIRNISIGCVWLLSFVLMAVTALYAPNLPSIPLFCLLVFSLIAVSFCSLSVLHVLIRPGPGDRGGKEERVDQSKRRAFLTVTAILGVLGLSFVGFLVSAVLHTSALENTTIGCVVVLSASWINLPSSLLLSVLYLHRAGKLPCC